MYSAMQDKYRNSFGDVPHKQLDHASMYMSHHAQQSQIQSAHAKYLLKSWQVKSWKV